MALKIQGKLQNGMEIIDGYVMVTEFAVHTPADEIMFNCSLFYSKEARDNGLMPLISNYCGGLMKFNKEDGDYIGQIYSHIKQKIVEEDMEFIHLKGAEDI